MYFWGFVVSIESLILILFLVAFYILGERKILSYIQFRKGPNKVGLVGLLQSFADFIKLLCKSKMVGFSFRSWFSLLGCVIMIICSFFMVEIFSFVESNKIWSWSLLYLLIVSSIIGYSLLIIGWCSWSKFGLISSIRVSFSSVMFEMVFMCVLILFGILYNNYKPEIDSVMGIVVPMVLISLLLVLMSEVNRTPFDYAESESELVSGVSVEYSSILFLVIFACEYLIMYIFSWISFILFFGFSKIFIVVILVLFIFMRGSFPRLRFDEFVVLVWEYSVVILLIYLFSFYGL
uniref:NADH-ubiquinone oxidoreductase chain 1 n=1 Tax=Schistosoma spindalis TaxID=6189 RepID=A0A6G9KB25_SCHSI|nr:NADH dehydrogenase subunit 1 [Schistosoma spindale]